MRTIVFQACIDLGSRSEVCKTHMSDKATTVSASLKHYGIIAIALIVFTLVTPLSSYAGGVNTELNRMFNSLGIDSNTTKPGSFKDQSGGYYTGGRFFARNQVSNTQLMSITPPDFRAGCGGIDIFTGGFSYINKDALVKAMKTIASNAGSYAFSLALQTVTPQIYNTLTELNAMAQEINNASINSCETAATMLGSVWPKNDTSSRYLCSAMGTNNNKFSDWAEARQECGKLSNRTAGGKNDRNFKDVLGDEFNLAWTALRKNRFLSTDDSLAEFFMSISGTIISKEIGEGKYQKTHYSSLAKSEEFIQSLIEGNNNVSLYKCDETDKCLNINTHSVKIAKSQGLVPKVEAILRSMSRKIRTDTDADNKEMALVNASTIPIFKVLAVQAAFREGSSPIEVHQFSEAIAYDLLLKYLEEVLDVIEESLRELRKVQLDDSSIESLKKDISNTRRLLLEKRNGIFQQMHTALSVIDSTKMMEQQIHNMFTQTNSRK